MSTIFITVLLLHLTIYSHSFVHNSFLTSSIVRSKSSTTNVLLMSDSDAASAYKSITISGFISKQSNKADSFVFSKIFEKGNWESITAGVDDIAFARKRLVNPTTVYSGLIDILKYAEVKIDDITTYHNALIGNDAWICSNIDPAQLHIYADLAIKAGLKRVVFGVLVEKEADKVAVDDVYESITSKLSSSNINYTIIKHIAPSKIGESRVPYRIVRGALPLPTGDKLACDDLMRILAEVVDIPKTFNSVYGLGQGSSLDTEILVYMKAQGWPERVQIGLLMGDMMERIEASYAQEKAGSLKGNKGDAAVPALPMPVN